VREHERREVDLLGQLDEPVERRHAGVEDGRPRLDLRDLRQPARQRLDQLRLLAGRVEENAGFHAGRLGAATNEGFPYWRPEVGCAILAGAAEHNSVASCDGED
jgi:hypothetical protein